MKHVSAIWIDLGDNWAIIFLSIQDAMINHLEKTVGSLFNAARKVKMASFCLRRLVVLPFEEVYFCWVYVAQNFEICLRIVYLDDLDFNGWRKYRIIFFWKHHWNTNRLNNIKTVQMIPLQKSSMEHFAS